MDFLLGLVGKAVRQQPDYRPELCIAVKKSVGACSACRDVCPHAAITINQRVVIDELDCSGCGLCIQACPSEALAVDAKIRPEGTIKCSRVQGNAQTVECLGRLQATDLLRLGSGRDKVTLARRDCVTCLVGDTRVLDAIDRVVAEAATLAAYRSRPLEIEVVEERKLMRDERPTEISRRDLLTLGVKNVQVGVSDALAKVDFGSEIDTSLPDETHRRFAWLSHAKPADDALVPWTLPRVADTCILCPVCTNVCPTKAFDRRLDTTDERGVRLLLSPERCNGCDACVASCPVHAITLDVNVTWGELRSGPTISYERPPVARRAFVAPSKVPTQPAELAGRPAPAGPIEPQ